MGGIYVKITLALVTVIRKSTVLSPITSDKISENFFLVAEAALLSAFYAIQTKLISPPDQVNLGDLWSNKALALAGLLLTVIWLFVSCSSAYWIRRWRREVKTVSEYLSNISSYKNVEEVGCWTDLLRPEHITVLLPLLFLGLWAFALFKVLC